MKQHEPGFGLISDAAQNQTVRDLHAQKVAWRRVAVILALAPLVMLGLAVVKFFS